jgi:hypothetical protein
MDKVTLPDGLESITFGSNFNQPLDKVVFPLGLKSVTFGECFNQSLEKVNIPPNLESITFGEGFNQNLDNVIFPESLHSISFGMQFTQNLHNAKFPKDMKKIVFENWKGNQLNFELKIDELMIGTIDEPLDNLPSTIGKIILYVPFSLCSYDSDYFSEDTEHYVTKEQKKQISISKIPHGCEVIYN